ncbi:MAG: CcmD family protein [Anaerolineae bacterium]
MADLLYLMLAYAAFWIISFVFIFSIFSRQRKLDEELTMLKELLDAQPEE